MKKQISTLLLTIGLLSSSILPVDLSISKKKNEIKINFKLDKDESILKNSIKIASESPTITLSKIEFSNNFNKKYLADFKDSKEIYDSSFSVTATADYDSEKNLNAEIYASYMMLPSGKAEEKHLKLKVNPGDSKNTDQENSTTSKKGKKSYLESFQDAVQTTDSIWLKLLSAMLLGLLLSLTPCIYPMIPITIGILHRHGKKSVIYNFFGALSYAIGLSTTFAVLGLLAAFAGASFGGLLSNPIFVSILIIFIGFMSLSMIGIVDMPIPSFMQGGGTEIDNSIFGPFISAFLFGIVSGTIASPCVSPGLALLLAIVATMANMFTGFMLLFSFGIGMSVPLIIIGTFSSSLQMLPRAGEWMIEIKKIIGFVMLATCFYYLKNIMPENIVIWLFIGYILFAALFYIIDAQHSFDKKTKTIKSLIGIILIATTVFMSYKTYENQITTNDSQDKAGVTWANNYAKALEQSKDEKKLLLLDFWAQYCTICKAIDKKIFNSPKISKALKDKVIFFKVDCTSSSNEESNFLKKKYAIFAQPAVLLINPEDEKLLKKWSSEPYSMSNEEFIDNVIEFSK